MHIPEERSVPLASLVENCESSEQIFMKSLCDDEEPPHCCKSLPLGVKSATPQKVLVAFQASASRT